MSSQGIHIITKRIYYAVQVRLASPLSISSGRDDTSDSDVIRNGSDIPFVPGTSLAGAFRNYLELSGKTDGIMGYSDGEEGRMSSFFISDMYFASEKSDTMEKPYVITVRDGVKLKEDKQVDNKFDMEIIETGATGTLFFQYVVRDGLETEDDCIRNAAIFLKAIQSGEIRLGGNKNRGFGRLEILKIFCRTFDKEKREEFLKFSPEFKEIAAYGIGKTYEEWETEIKKNGCCSGYSKYVKITVPLKLTGGISVRRYSTKPDQADFEHLTCNGMPVIPGTSWNGAIRSDAIRILKSLGIENTGKIIDQWFGFVEIKNQKKNRKTSETGGKSKEDRNKKACQSMVVFGESIIEGAKALPMTRNKVNRFDASTVDGALYSEIAYFGGKTELEIMVKKDTERNYQAFLGILDIIVKDILNGFLPVGGQTAVGRGIFETDGPVQWENASEDEKSSENGRTALYDLVTVQGGMR